MQIKYPSTAAAIRDALRILGDVPEITNKMVVEFLAEHGVNAGLGNVWKFRNPTRTKQLNRRAANKRRDTGKRMAYLNANREQINKQRRIRRQHPAIAEREQEANRGNERRLRQRVIAHLGGCCVLCDFDDWRGLQVDHINGGGTQEHARLSRHCFHKLVLTDDGTKYQLLCANCNQRKRHERGEGTNGKPNRHKAYRERLKTCALEKFGPCTHCGEDDPLALQLDHIRNNGTVERKQNSRSKIFRFAVLRGSIADYQLLCANCNQIKRYAVAELEAFA